MVFAMKFVMSENHRCFTFVLLFALCFIANSSFALPQIKNNDFNGNINNWTTTAPVTGGYGSTVDYNTNDLRIYGNHNGGMLSGNRTYDGMARQDIITVSEPVNAHIEWGYWCNNKDVTLYLVLGPSGGNLTGTQLFGAKLANNQLNGNRTATYDITYTPSSTETLAIKVSASASLGRGKNYTARFQYVRVNLSPTGLTATTDNSEKVVLTWNVSTSNAATLRANNSYAVYRSTTENGTYTQIGTTNTNSYNDTTAAVGTTYYYKISDFDSTGAESPKSVAVQGRRPMPSPTDLTVTATDAGAAKLTWTVLPGFGTYRVYRATTSGGPYTLLGNLSGATSGSVSYTNAGLEPDTTYYFVVRTYVNPNEGSNSNEVSLTIPRPQAPNLKIQSISDTSVSLSWNKITYPLSAIALSGYRLYRSETAGSGYTQIGTFAPDVLSYSDTNVEPGKTYYYVIDSYTPATKIKSVYSNEVSATIPRPIEMTVKDGTPSGEEIRELVLNDSYADIDVSWTLDNKSESLTLTKYVVKIMNSGGTAIATADNVAPSEITHHFTGVSVVNGGYYYATVEAVYTSSSGTGSSVFNSDGFTTVVPRNMTVIDGWSGKDIAYSTFDNRVEANWSHATDVSIIRYEAAVGTTRFGTDVLGWTDIGLPDRISLTGLTLASGTTYYTSVRGINQKGTQVIIGCTDGFKAIKDPAESDTDASKFFNNARVLENLNTANGKLTPVTDQSNKYYIPITIREPNITERVNAPCLVNFTIPAGQQPANIREFRVYDDRGNEIPRYNLTTPNNSTTAHPYIVFLVNMRRGETKTYYVYWGSGTTTEPAYGFVNNTNANCLNAWTPYYTRKDMAAGNEDVALNTRRMQTDDGNTTEYLSTANGGPLSKFYFFGQNRVTNPWYLNSNGYISSNQRTGSDCYSNTFAKFTGTSGNILGKCVCPLWVDHQSGTAWSASGIFRDNITTDPRRVIFTWITYRWNVTDDAYQFQAVLYQTGDIAVRYKQISPRALITNGTYDRAVNTSNEHTVGISNGDGTRYLYHTPLVVGINQNPTAFYQCMNAFDDTTTYGTIQGNANDYTIAHFESDIFDTRVSTPQWDSIKYDATVTGSRKIVLYYRTGNTDFPDGSWTNWSTATNITSTTTNGSIPVTTQGRYIQYKAEFCKTGTTGTMSLDEVRFIYGGISVEQVSAYRDGEPITEVSQGEKDIPVSVSIKNTFVQPVTLPNANTTATMTFSIGGHSAVLSSLLPVTIEPDGIATLSFLVSIADDAPTGLCTIDALATATYNTLTFSDHDAQTPLKWTVKSKAVLRIDKVVSEKTKVSKGQSGLPLSVHISNLGDSDCLVDYASPTFVIGQYTFTMVSPADGKLTIPGNSTGIATFAVSISKNSESGSDTIGANASATNLLSGERVEIAGTDNPHLWMIQNPASLILNEVIASATVYRGQKNNPIILRVQNQGEAEMEWHTNDSDIYFTPEVGSYENMRKESGEDVINLVGNAMSDATFMVDIKADTATGTDMIDATVSGTELNTMQATVYDKGAIIPGQWTIFAERVNTYKDGAFANENNSFNKPDGTDKVIVYMRAENLSCSEEYVVHWFDPDGVEFVTTAPRSGDLDNNIYYEHEFTSTSKSGIYKIKVTNPLGTVVCCENSFEIVAPASMIASFTLPQYATVGQSFTASFTYINEGGALIEGATLADHVTKTGTGGIAIIPASDGLEFTPKYSDINGYGQATATYSLTAVSAGTLRLANTATGYDANSGKTLSTALITSNQMTIQTAPDIQITLSALPAAKVYLNQKNLRLTATIRNNGQATAVINCASMTCNIGLYQQELMGQELPFELAGGQSKTLTFDISVAPNSASGLDSLKIYAQWYDKNWEESGLKESYSTDNRTWEIVAAGIILSNDPDFAEEHADFSRGQTVYVRAYGVQPYDAANVRYYRIRFYTTQIAQANQVPTGYVSTDQGYSGLLVADDSGYVFHSYTLPTNATIGTWSVTLETVAAVNTAAGTRGNMLALQYFRVQNDPSITAEIAIDDSKDVFVGDTFKVTMTIRNTVDKSAAVDNISPYTLIKATGATGDAILVSGPEPATCSVRALESKTFEYTFRATEQTGDISRAANRYKLTTNTHAAVGKHQNQGTEIYANVVTSNGLIIYSQSIGVTPNPVDFGHMICGETHLGSDFTIQKTGNYPVPNIRLNAADFNGSIVDGVMNRISKAHFAIVPEQIDMLNNDTMIEAHVVVPYNQAADHYETTMFVYSDANGNGVFDAGEITAEFRAGLTIDQCWLIKATEEVVEMGDWPKGAKGTVTNDFEVSFFNAGNMPLYNVKVKPTPEASATFNFNVSETNIGPLAIGESHTITINADTTKQDPEPISGTYIATFTIWEDENNDGSVQPSEPTETVQAIITVGNIEYEVTPNRLQASPVEASRSVYTGVLDGFSNLTIRNKGELALTRIKMQVGDGGLETSLTDGAGHYIDPVNLIIAPGTLVEKVARNTSDEFSLALFVPAATNVATYTTDLFFYSDDNRNDVMDENEYRQSVAFTVYVMPTKKIQVSNRTVTLGGVMAEPDTSTQKLQTFSCRNIGNTELTNLFIIPQNFVHQVDNSKVIEAVCASFPPDIWFSCDGIGNFFFPTVLLTVPAGTEDGVYITSVNCVIFEDENHNSRCDPGEASDTFKIMVEVGELKIELDKNKLYVNGDPNEVSTQDTMYVKNIGSLDVINITGTASTLIDPDGHEIESKCNVFSPKNAGTLIGGQSKALAWSVKIPDGAIAGTYTCDISAWGDSNNNGKIDEGEACATATGYLYVEESIEIDILSETLEFTETLTTNSSVMGAVEVKNAGNMVVTGLKTIQSDLKMGSSTIGSGSISVNLQSTSIDLDASILATYTVTVGNEILPTGIYSGEQTIYVDLNDNDVLDADEPYDTVILKVVVGEKELTFDKNPLDFGELALSSTDTQNLTGMNTGSAALKKIRAFRDTQCTCGRCNDTTITLKSPTDSVAIARGENYEYFVFDISVGPNTPAGIHKEIWRFYDDDNNNGVWDRDSGEYSTTLEIRYTVEEDIKVLLTPASYTANVEPKSVATMTYTITNIGNTDLETSRFTWEWGGMFLDSSNYIASSAITILDMQPTGVLLPGSSTTVLVQIDIGNLPEGTYSTATIPGVRHKLKYDIPYVAEADMQLIINSTGPVIPKDSLHQEIASSTFAECNMATMSYFLSCWVCPGEDSSEAPSKANMSVVRYGPDGNPKAHITISIPNDIAARIEGSSAWVPNKSPSLKMNDGYYVLEDDLLRCESFGISGNPVSATAGSDSRLTFYRIYMKFKVSMNSEADSQDTFRIILSSADYPVISETTRVYFDGLKLEKSFDEFQDRPTTYHEGTTLFSPSHSLDMGGRHSYYEW